MKEFNTIKVEKRNLLDRSTLKREKQRGKLNPNLLVVRVHTNDTKVMLISSNTVNAMLFATLYICALHYLQLNNNKKPCVHISYSVEGKLKKVNSIQKRVQILNKN